MKKLSITNSTDLKIKNSIERWYLSATESDIKHGLNWYKDAQNFVLKTANQYKIKPYIVACVLSALSPNNKWERNKLDCVSVINAFLNDAGIDSIKVCTYTQNKIKAFKILAGTAELTEISPKTHAFAMNVGLLSERHVTVDKWHLRACLTHPKHGIKQIVETCTSAQYQRIEAITAELAIQYGLKAYQLQAIIWVSIKNAWGRP